MGAAAFAHVDPPGSLRGSIQQRRIDEIVIDHRLALLQQLQPPEGNEVCLAAARAHQIHPAHAGSQIQGSFPVSQGTALCHAGIKQPAENPRPLSLIGNNIFKLHSLLCQPVEDRLQIIRNLLFQTFLEINRRRGAGAAGGYTGREFTPLNQRREQEGAVPRGVRHIDRNILAFTQIRHFSVDNRVIGRRDHHSRSDFQIRCLKMPLPDRDAHCQNFRRDPGRNHGGHAAIGCQLLQLSQRHRSAAHHEDGLFFQIHKHGKMRHYASSFAVQ